MEWPLSLFATVLLFLAFVLSAIWYMSRYEADNLFNRRKDQLMMVLGTLGSIALLITIFDRRQNLERQVNQDAYRVKMDDLANQRANFLAPLKDILSYYPESLPIYYEMFGGNGGKVPAQLPPINPMKRKMTEQNIALTVFQIVENFLTVALLTDPKVAIEWVSRLVVWFQSPTLQAEYQRSKAMFSDDAIVFIDNIIKQSNKLKAHRMKTNAPISVELVRQYAQEIEFTPRTIA